MMMAREAIIAFQMLLFPFTLLIWFQGRQDQY